jgi:hypothetical protein
VDLEAITVRLQSAEVKAAAAREVLEALRHEADGIADMGGPDMPPDLMARCLALLPAQAPVAVAAPVVDDTL